MVGVRIGKSRDFVDDFKDDIESAFTEAGLCDDHRLIRTDRYAGRAFDFAARDPSNRFELEEGRHPDSGFPAFDDILIDFAGKLPSPFT